MTLIPVVGSLTPGQALVGVVHRELIEIMGGAQVPLNFATQPPAIFLMASQPPQNKLTGAPLVHITVRLSGRAFG